MRYGVISDVHANLPALEAVLAALAGERVDRLLCAGDLVGYGPQPNECVARLAEAGARCVAGNHDLIALGRLSFERTDALARETLEWTRREIDEATRAFLDGLPPRIVDGPVAVAHGSLDDPEVYVRSDAAAAGELERLASAEPAAEILVLGHTHVARAHRSGSGPVALGRRSTVALDAADRVLLNPGSVGQARERRALARFLVIDTRRGEARFGALPYDVRRTRRALAARALPAGACHRKPTLRGRAGAARAALRRTVTAGD